MVLCAKYPLEQTGINALTSLYAASEIKATLNQSPRLLFDRKIEVEDQIFFRRERILGFLQLMGFAMVKLAR
jgi:hypothetical protein